MVYAKIIKYIRYNPIKENVHEYSERYIKVIESLVNGEEAKVTGFYMRHPEKAREIWNDLVQADEVVEDEVAEEEIDEVGDEKADDFTHDIQEDDKEIQAEEKCTVKTKRAKTSESRDS